jgi:hypothetical protein
MNCLNPNRDKIACLKTGTRYHSILVILSQLEIGNVSSIVRECVQDRVFEDKSEW